MEYKILNHIDPVYAMCADQGTYETSKYKYVFYTLDHKNYILENIQTVACIEYSINRSNNDIFDNVLMLDEHEGYIGNAIWIKNEYGMILLKTKRGLIGFNEELTHRKYFRQTKKGIQTILLFLNGTLGPGNCDCLGLVEFNYLYRPFKRVLKTMCTFCAGIALYCMIRALCKMT